MTTPQALLNKIGEELNTQWIAHPSVSWYNRVTGSSYYPDAYFCAAGLSRAFDAIGMGAAVGGPWIWTVGWYNWCLRNLSKVSAANAQPGDIAFWKFGASGDRGTAPVNHVNAVKTKGATLFRGYNEGSGGTGGWVKDVAYSHANLVAIFRPKWPSAPQSGGKEVKYRQQSVVRPTRLAAGKEWWLKAAPEGSTNMNAANLGGPGVHSGIVAITADGLPAAGSITVTPVLVHGKDRSKTSRSWPIQLVADATGQISTTGAFEVNVPSGYLLEFIVKASHDCNLRRWGTNHTLALV